MSSTGLPLPKRDPLFDALPPIFADWVKWLLDRDPEYAARFIRRLQEEALA